MKHIFSAALIAGAMLTLNSCDDFLTELPTTSIPDHEAFLSTRDYEVALRGAYNTLGEAEFLGRNALALGDVSTDISDHSVATSHFYNIFTYQILETNVYLEEIWSYGYKAIDRSTRIIEAAKNATDFTEGEMTSIRQSVAQAYGIKALSEFILVNYYGLPYSEANKTTPGIVNVTKQIEPFEEVSRATVEENYQLILADLDSAKAFFYREGVQNVGNSFMNKAALHALESRVRLYLNDYDGAILAANEAIAVRNGKIASTPEAYQALFNSQSPSTEDIFVLAKTESDYLTANSLNTLYKDYGSSINASTISEFADTDIRRSMMDGKWIGGKLAGTLQSDGSYNDIQNVPVIRLPEVYLNLAEAYAMKGSYKEAKESLLAVAAERNPSLDTKIIKEDASIIPVILKERKLELLQEGHRFFDARRQGESISVSNGDKTNFDVAKFVYPIPAKEINSAAGVAQTPNWDANLPK